MKRTIALTMLILLLGTTAAFGQQRFGVGVIAGQPTGVTAKLWLGSRASIDAAVAWSFLHSGSMYMHLDFQYHSFQGEGYTPDVLGFFVGLGTRFLAADYLHFGLRLPFGLIYPFRNAPLDVFLELAPAIEFYPYATLSGGAVLGMRVYF